MSKIKNSGRVGKPARRKAGTSDKAARPASRVPALAHDGDPYVTHKGKIIQPESFDGKPNKERDTKAKAFRPDAKRTSKELPASPAAMKGIAVIFVYTVLGLTDREIGDLLSLTVTQVKSVREHVGYSEVFNIVSAEFVNASSALLTARIASYAEAAVDTIADISQNGTKEETKLRASIDLADRAGVRPKDTADRAKREGNELRITILKEGDANIAINGITVDV